MGIMNWQAPQNRVHFANWTVFLDAMARYMNSQGGYKQWTPEQLVTWFGNLEAIFHQGKSNAWAFGEVPEAWWPRLFAVYACLGNEALPLLHKIDPKARIIVMNAYRTPAKQKSLISKEKQRQIEEKTKAGKRVVPSQHVLFAATDVYVEPRSLMTEFKYIMDRLYAIPGLSKSLPKMGLGLYGPEARSGNFIHLDSRQDKGSSYTWYGNIDKNGNGETARTIGVLTYAEYLAGAQSSPIPERAAGLGLVPPASGQTPSQAAAVRNLLGGRGLSLGALAAQNSLRGQGVLSSISQEAGGDDAGVFGENPNSDVVHDDGVPGILEIQGVGLADYVTPEERIKGIIAQHWTMEDWALTQMVEGQSTFSVMTGQALTTISNVGESIAAQVEQNNPNTGLGAVAGAIRADLGDDPRRRYVQALVEAEFWDRRYRGRSMPQVSGRFNPYVVSGFPALVLLPDRPVIAEITSITHTITVSAPSANTTISLGAPRYWDEGEPWYFLGGWGELDHSASGALWRRYWRRFPYWHSQYAMPTNSWTDKARKNKRKTQLDRFYQNILGCDAIEYESNHAWVFRQGDYYEYELAKRVVRDRDRLAVEVNPATLDVREYNAAIAQLDKDGRFAKHTLAYKFWGGLKPYDPPEGQEGRMADGEEYTERYGVSEDELLRDFLGNRFTQYVPYKRGPQYAVMVGPTFGGGGQGADQVSAAQRRIIEYVTDISRRSIGGGVR